MPRINEEFLLCKQLGSSREFVAESVDVCRYLVGLYCLERNLQKEPDEFVGGSKSECLIGRAFSRIHLELITKQLRIEANFLKIFGPLPWCVVPEYLQFGAILAKLFKPGTECLVIPRVLLAKPLNG